MSEIVDFIKEKYVSIAVIVSIIFVLLLIISIREWDLNPPKPDSKLVQQVTVETFEPTMEKPNYEEVDEIKYWSYPKIVCDDSNKNYSIVDMKFV